MPVTLKFHSTKELRPPHGKEVVYLKGGSSFGMLSFDPAVTTVDYCWFAIDEDGDFTGEQVIYEPDGPTPDGCVLEIMFGNEIVTEREYVWWMLADEYFDAFPETD